jgi:hypothetical protein
MPAHPLPAPDAPLTPGGQPAQPQPQPIPRPVPPPTVGPSPAPIPRPATPPVAGEDKPKIQAFNQALGGQRKAESWKRKPNADGTGATHVKTFHAKLNSEAVAFLDEQINQWLDEHPELEVKFVNSTVGEWQGKLKEPALIVSVWV